MQVQTDLINICGLKLNSSSIGSSTPGNNVSFPDGEYIKFEQFKNEQNNTERQGLKKKLTIQINDSYDFNPSSIGDQQLNMSDQSQIEKDIKNINFFKKVQKNDQINHYDIGQSLSPSFANSNSQTDLQKIINQNIILIQKITNLQYNYNSLNQTYNHQLNYNQNLKDQNQNYKNIIKNKQQMFMNEKQKNIKLNQKINLFQSEKQQNLFIQQKLKQKIQQNLFYQQKLKQKQNKIQQLQRKLQKITNMNKTFQKQLKDSDKKIMQLQKDLQKTFCQNQHQTINRIKQSSIRMKQASIKSKQLICNKQNLNQNTMTNTIQMRKSLDKKKCSQSQGKKKQQPQQPLTTMRGQKTSSTTNIVSKKLLVIKKQ